MKKLNNFLITNTADYHESLIESLCDPEEAAAYLKVALEEYEQDRDETPEGNNLDDYGKIKRFILSCRCAKIYF